MVRGNNNKTVIVEAFFFEEVYIFTYLYVSKMATGQIVLVILGKAFVCEA